VPRRGSSTSDISPALHFGQRCSTRKVVAPQLPQVLLMSWGFSSGQVEISGASAICSGDAPLTIIGNGVLV
jgi:hypothetical protein